MQTYRDREFRLRRGQHRRRDQVGSEYRGAWRLPARRFSSFAHPDVCSAARPFRHIRQFCDSGHDIRTAAGCRSAYLKRGGRCFSFFVVLTQHSAGSRTPVHTRCRSLSLDDRLPLAGQQQFRQIGEVHRHRWLPDRIASVFLLLALFGKQIDYLLSV